MVEPTPSSELDTLIEAARCAQPDELTPLHARRVVRSALAEAERRPRVRRRALLWASATVACVAALAFVWLSPHSTAIELASDALPLRLSLKTGDSLVIAAGTRLTVLDDAAPTRAIELEQGTVLFDVARLAAGQSFEVQTRAARVRVLGTVFSVSVEGDKTSVHVHEGKVAVGGRLLRANQAWSSSGVVTNPRVPFEREARAFVLARTSRAAPSVASAVRVSTPVVSPLQGPPADARALQTREEASVSRAPTGHATSLQASREASVPQAQLEPPNMPSIRQFDTLPSAGAEPGEGEPPRPALVVESDQAAPEAALDWLALGRRELARGQAERALAVASAHGESGAALRLAADALRALGRFEEALVQYELAALRSSDEQRAQAGYGAAQLALGSLHEAARALALIERFELDAESSPLRERASLLRIEALLALGRKNEALSAAHSYLAREPETATSRRLRTLFEGAL